MSELCKLNVINKKKGTVVVANRIIAPKEKVLVPFSVLQQLRDALAAERNNIIKIASEIPDDVKQLLGDVKEKEEEVKVNQKDKNDEKVEMPTEKFQDTDGLTIDTEKAEDEDLETPTEKLEDVAATNVKSAPDRDEIIDFTVKEMRAHLKNFDVEIEGHSKMNSRELTNELLKHYGYEVLAEDEVDR